MKYRTVLVSLLIMGNAGLLTACVEEATITTERAFEAETIRKDDTPVAKVNDTTIYQSDVRRLAITQGLIEDDQPFEIANPNFKSVLDELVDQRLLALNALEVGLNQEEDAQRRLMTARERILGNLRIEDHLKDTVNDETIRRLYDEQAALGQRGQERRARHIVLETEKAAQDVIKQLENGAKFADLAEDKSLDLGSAQKGGDLDWFSRDMLNNEFTKPVFEADIGDRIGPFKTEFGWHVVEVLNARMPNQPSFEDMKPEIVNFMTYDAIQSLLTDLRADGEVQIIAQPKEDAGVQDKAAESQDEESSDNE